MAGSSLRIATTCAALALAGLTLAPLATQAQSLEAQRQAVFAQLVAAPADPDLMLQYARLSVQMRDFEAAAATLERYVDLYPANTGARIELAIAYYSLGAYEVAEYHLTAAQASGQLTQAQLDQVTRYQGESAERAAPNRFSGRLAIGQAWTRQTEETARFGSASLEWRADMGGANADDWVTEFAYSSYLPGEQSFNDRQIARLRSGPEFRLTGDAYGPRLQPYIELEAFRDDSFVFGDYNAAAIGLAYQNPHSAQWTSYGDIRIGRAQEVDASGVEFDFRDASIGAAFRPSRETRLRGSLRWRLEEGNGLEQTTRTVRLEAMHMFDPGAAFLPRRWEVSGFFDRSRTDQDFGGFTNAFTDTALGASLRAFVTQELFVEARGLQLERDNSGFVQEETVYALQIGWEF